MTWKSLVPLSRTSVRDGLRRVFSPNVANRDAFVTDWARRLPPNTLVLDIGAGGGRYRQQFAHCRYVAQDLAALPELDAVAAHLDLIADASALPLRTGSVQAALCTEVLEHVPDPVQTVQEMARVLRAGGSVLMTAPLGSGLHQQPYHFYGGYTPYWYERFLARAGLEQIVVRPNGGFFLLFGQESQRFSALLAPHRHSGLARACLALPWLVTLPLFRVLVPLLCWVLGGTEHDPELTVGYHVTARRGTAGATQTGAGSR
jgi:SAM-dependent methyltransferase